LLNKIIVKIVQLMPRKLVWKFSKKYIAGETLQEAVSLVKDLNSKGILATIDVLGEAVKNKKYNCFLRDDTELPMMYMPDCIKATIDLAEANYDNLKHHSDFNLAAMSFDPKSLAEEIKKHIPEFEITYNPDYRQAIADSWPKSIDDSSARNEWNWQPSFDLVSMTKDMISKLQAKHELGLI